MVVPPGCVMQDGCALLLLKLILRIPLLLQCPLCCRDFTINSLFYNLNDDTVEDFSGKGAVAVAAQQNRTAAGNCYAACQRHVSTASHLMCVLGTLYFTHISSTRTLQNLDQFSDMQPMQAEAGNRTWGGLD